GNVTFVLPGEAKIGALVNGKSGTLSVTIKPLPATRIEVKAPAAAIAVGTGVPLAVIARTANGDPRSDVAVTWSSSNTAIAMVDDSGFVSGVSPGTATIVAAAGSEKNSVTVQVVRNPVRTLTVEPKTAKARTGDVIHFSVQAKGDKDAVIAS